MTELLGRPDAPDAPSDAELIARRPDLLDAPNLTATIDTCRRHARDILDVVRGQLPAVAAFLPPEEADR